MAVQYDALLQVASEPAGTQSQRKFGVVVQAGEELAYQPVPRRAARSLRGIFFAAAGSATAFAAWRLSSGGQKAEWDDEGGLRGPDRPIRLYDKTVGGLEFPRTATQYDGWPDTRPVDVHEVDGVAHVFAIGDWGASLQEGHQTFKAVEGLDLYEQYTIRDSMRNRAEWAKPSYILNVGDNFYLGGIVFDCNLPLSAVHGQPASDFTRGWSSIYGELAEIPWLSVLGNHDYGGWQFNQGWTQQIAYSFVNYNWIMPARYFNKVIHHSNFDIEYFMLDSNAYDAKAPGEEPTHNMCSQAHNPPGASCAANGGAQNMWECETWFKSSWEWQKKWMVEKIQQSTARWKIVVTHFPCGYDAAFYRELREKWGLDLLVTGHRHQQELWKPNTKSNYVRSFMEQTEFADVPCFVTGGGGGITAQKFHDADYGEDLQWYGFFDLSIHKDWLKMELVGPDAKVHGSYSIQPHDLRPDFLAAPTSTKTTTTVTTTTTTTTTVTTTTTTTTSTTATTTTSTTNTTTWGPGLPIPTLPPPTMPPMDEIWTPPPAEPADMTWSVPSVPAPPNASTATVPPGVAMAPPAFVPPTLMPIEMPPTLAPPELPTAFSAEVPAVPLMSQPLALDVESKAADADGDEHP